MDNKRIFLITFLIALIIMTAALFMSMDRDTISSNKERLYIQQEEPEKEELNKVTIDGSSLEDIRVPEVLDWPEDFAVTGPSAITIESIIKDGDLTRVTFESSLAETKAIIAELKESGYNTVYLEEYPDNVSYEGYNEGKIVRVSYYAPLLSVVETVDDKYEPEYNGKEDYTENNLDAVVGNNNKIPEGPNLIPDTQNQWPSYNSNGFDNPGGNIIEVEHTGMSVIITMDDIDSGEYSEYIEVISNRGYTYNIVSDKYETGSYYEAYDINNKFIKIQYVNNGIAVIEIGQLI